MLLLKLVFWWRRLERGVLEQESFVLYSPKIMLVQFAQFCVVPGGLCFQNVFAYV